MLCHNIFLGRREDIKKRLLPRVHRIRDIGSGLTEEAVAAQERTSARRKEKGRPGLVGSCNRGLCLCSIWHLSERLPRGIVMLTEPRSLVHSAPVVKPIFWPLDILYSCAFANGALSHGSRGESRRLDSNPQFPVSAGDSAGKSLLEVRVTLRFLLSGCLTILHFYYLRYQSLRLLAYLICADLNG